MSQIGKNLKLARIAAGLTQKEVESRLGLRNLTIRDYETERLKLPADLTAKFADLYNVKVSDLISEPEKSHSNQQDNRLAEVRTLFRRGPFETLLLDPIIRASLEEVSDKIFDHSIFDLMTLSLNKKAKLDVSLDILKCLGSLMGVDAKVSESEMKFFQELMEYMEVDTQGKSVSRAISEKYLPKIDAFKQNAALKHFMMWVMFFLAKSDGKISREESLYIEECAEILKINRSNFLFIKKHFVKEAF